MFVDFILVFFLVFGVVVGVGVDDVFVWEEYFVMFVVGLFGDFFDKVVVFKGFEEEFLI